MTRPMEWISGCAILVRRALIEEVGMLDAEYFLYWKRQNGAFVQDRRVGRFFTFHMQSCGTRESIVIINPSPMSPIM